MSQLAATLFNTSTNAGSLRIEGVVLAMIEWFVQAGGLESLESRLEEMGFDNLAALPKKDSEIGDAVLKQHDYVADFIRSVLADPTMSAVLGTVRTEETKQGFDRTLAWRMSAVIGHRTIGGWWKKNEKRIKKVREDLKTVRNIMES